MTSDQSRDDGSKPAGHQFKVPDAWLESVAACPVCGANDRRELAAHLRDINYGVVAGEWRFHRCTACHTAYLDPRIDSGHIACAYADYETHTVRGQPPARSGLGRFIRDAVDAYSANRYGYPTGAWPAWLGMAAYLFPPLRLERDFAMRHASKGSGCTVLDIGCGNGEFLARMKQAGWDASGVDFDPVAVAIARAQGLDVTLAAVGEALPERVYDLVAASHVIEHVHDPIGFLRDLFSRVAPGGKLWLATPNVDSPLRQLEGGYWDKWEIPRHLQIFSAGSLKACIETALGVEPRFRRRGWHLYWSMAQSRRLREGKLRGERPSLPWRAKLLAVVLELAALISPHWGDEFVVEVSKPGES